MKNILITIFLIAIIGQGYYIYKQKQEVRGLKEEKTELTKRNSLLSLNSQNVLTLTASITEKDATIDKLKTALIYCAGIVDSKGKTSTNTSCHYWESSNTFNCTTY